MAGKKTFSEVLLTLEWTCNAQSGKTRSALGFPRRTRPTEPAARLQAFIPWLGIEFLCEVAAPLGLKPIPPADDPRPEVYRGFGWFLLGVVACLWKLLLQDSVRVDLEDMSIRALSLLYMECPEEVQGVEGSTVLNRFSQELIPSSEFKAYLEQLENAVEAYVAVRAIDPSPLDRKKVVGGASALLRNLLGSLEVRQG